MAIIVTAGRTAMAAALAAQPMHIAVGEGEPWWHTDQTATEAFDGNDDLVLAHAAVSNVTVATPDHDPDAGTGTLYQAGADYTLSGATLTRLAAGAIPTGATVLVRYRADVPPEPADRTALKTEVGRRPADVVDFVLPDPQGIYVTSTGRWTPSADPTRHLYVATTFDFQDADSATIRETGVFVGTAVHPALPPGQMFFTPGELTSPGTLLLLQHELPIYRQPTIRHALNFVMTL